MAQAQGPLKAVCLGNLVFLQPFAQGNPFPCTGAIQVGPGAWTGPCQIGVIAHSDLSILDW